MGMAVADNVQAGGGRKGGNYMDKRKRAQYSSRMMFKCADPISEISDEERVRNT